MIITVLMPDGSTPDLQIADTDLVYDGREFVTPETAKYVELYFVDVQALSLPFNIENMTNELLTSVRIVARVIGRDGTTVPVTSPSVVVAVNPSPGTCVCFVTCSGTELRFVKVEAE